MHHYRLAAERESKQFLEHILICLKWIFLALILGIILGALSAAFSYSLTYVTAFRKAHSYIIWFLPIAGLIIAFLYKTFGGNVSKGTNMALAAINSDEQVPFRMTPLIFVSTIISHLFGASVGREGAALQMGASMGNTFADLLKLNENDKKILIMTGMSAAFSALFGAPLTAAIFSMEVISVGVMYYSALVPCVVSALTAISVAKYLGVSYTAYKLTIIPDFTPFTAGMSVILGLLCAVISIMICVFLILTERGFQNLFSNTYVRILVTGILIAAASFAIGSEDFNGLGTDVINAAIMGKTVWYAFLVKMIFTAVSLAGGYKGGEIVPVLFMGATFGCFASQFLGMPASLCAALGMIAVFCGVTNSPIASLLMGLELFGGKGLWFFCLVIAVSYMLSGYFGLYKSQLIIYSKYKSVYVRKPAQR